MPTATSSSTFSRMKLPAGRESASRSRARWVTPVERNRVKRLLREAFERAQAGMSGGYDVVVVARPGVSELAQRQGLAAIEEVAGRAAREVRARAERRRAHDPRRTSPAHSCALRSSSIARLSPRCSGDGASTSPRAPRTRSRRSIATALRAAWCSRAGGSSVAIPSAAAAMTRSRRSASSSRPPGSRARPPLARDGFRLSSRR